eukprot:gene33412-50720_t
MGPPPLGTPPNTARRAGDALQHAAPELADHAFDAGDGAGACPVCLCDYAAGDRLLRL